MKKLTLLILAGFLLPAFCFGAVGYERTPSGYTISNPVSFALTGVFDEYPTGLSWNLMFWYGVETYESEQCFSTNNGTDEIILPLGVYTRVQIKVYEQYADCTGDDVSYNLEFNEGNPIFEVVEEEEEEEEGGGLFQLPENSVGSITGTIDDLINAIGPFIWAFIGIPLAFVVINRIKKIFPR